MIDPKYSTPSMLQPRGSAASISLSPDFADRVAAASSLAVADMLAHYVPATLVRLKWPNDPLLGGLKVSGILIESGVSTLGGLWLPFV